MRRDRLGGSQYLEGVPMAEKVGQLSLRDISKELAICCFLNELGEPCAAKWRACSGSNVGNESSPAPKLMGSHLTPPPGI